MKKPDEIKKGLECGNNDIGCPICPYLGDTKCIQKRNADALALIQHLEREREVMLQDMKHLAMGSDYCDTCKHGKSEIEAIICQSHDFCCEECSAECACKDCFGCTNWEWRGVPEPPKEEE